MFAPLSILFCLICSQIQGPVQPAHGLFELYQQNRTAGIPNAITEDFVLLSYQLFLTQVGHQLEADYLEPRLRTLLTEMSTDLAKLEQTAEAVDCLHFVQVALALLRPDESPQVASVAAELNLVREAAGSQLSPILGWPLDYSQCRPSGAYEHDPSLNRYYRAFRYLSAPLFHLSASRATNISAVQADRMTAMALCMSRVIDANPASRKALAEINDVLGLLFGRPDDIGAAQLRGLEGEAAIPIRESRLQLCRRLLEQGLGPAIYDVAFDPKLLEQGQSAAEAAIGWRLMPRRFSPESAAFQSLVYGTVGEHLDPELGFTTTAVGGVAVKGFPMGEEYLALLGATQAQACLDLAGETHYRGYQAGFGAAQNWVAAATDLQQRHQELLKCVMAGRLGDSGQRSALGFWTLLCKFAQPYQKRSTTGVSKGLRLPNPRERACLEANTPLYSLLADTLDWLGQRLPGGANPQYLEILLSLKAMSGRLDAGETLDAQEQRYLNDLDVELLRVLQSEPDAPVIVAMHHNPASGQVLVEATGLPETVFLPCGDLLARGGRLTHHQFKQDCDVALDDLEWQRHLVLHSWQVP